MRESGIRDPGSRSWKAGSHRGLAACVAVALLSVAIVSRAAGAERSRGPVLYLNWAGDLSQGALARTALSALPAPVCALLQRVWWSAAPAVTLPSGQLLLAGGLPVTLGLAVPAASAERPGNVRLLETSRQWRAFGLLGLQSFVSYKQYRFERLDDRRR